MGRMYKPVKVHWNGSVDGLVGYSRYGADYFRMHANHVANPRTAAQIEVRERFAFISRLISLLDPAYKQGFKQSISNGQGPRAIAFKANEQAVTGDAASGYSINYALVNISKGTTPNPYNVTATVTSGEVNLTWIDNTGIYGAEATDKIFAHIINITKSEKTFVAAGNRADEDHTITLPTTWGGDNIVVYTYMVSKDGTCSETQYVGQYTA